MPEREPQKEPARQNCKFCGPGFPATWVVVSETGEEFVCDTHHYVLRGTRTIRRERILSDVEWNLNSSYEGHLAEHEFDDMDQWEDGSMYGF